MDQISFESPYRTTAGSVSTSTPGVIEQSGVISFEPPTFFMPTTPDEVKPAEAEPPAPPVLGSVSKRHLVTSSSPESWGWEQLRDYVVAQIVSTHGAFPRNLLKESGIFKGFITRHADRSGEIAIYAMEVAGGWWKNSPIGIERFAKGSDPWFAVEIKDIIDSRKRELTEPPLSA